MALYFLDDVFLLHFPLKAPECVFEGLSLLQSDFRQRNTPPNPSYLDLFIYCKVLGASQGLCMARSLKKRQMGRPRPGFIDQKIIFSATCTCRGGNELVAATGLAGTWKWPGK